MDAIKIFADAGSTPDVTCSTCPAACCKLEVMLLGENGIPPKFTIEDRWGGWIMRRLADGWCAALDRNTMLCTIYEQRPLICREYEAGDSDCMSQRSLAGAK